MRFPESAPPNRETARSRQARRKRGECEGGGVDLWTGGVYRLMPSGLLSAIAAAARPLEGKQQGEEEEGAGGGWGSSCPPPSFFLSSSHPVCALARDGRGTKRRRWGAAAWARVGVGGERGRTLRSFRKMMSPTSGPHRPASPRDWFACSSSSAKETSSNVQMKKKILYLCHSKFVRAHIVFKISTLYFFPLCDQIFLSSPDSS